jgi:hypothetical protein
VGIGGAGSGNLGELANALQETLASYTDNDDTIKLTDLLGRLEERIYPGLVHNFGLYRTAPVPRGRELAGGVNAPQNVYLELREFLSQLPVDQRSHFVPKAQGSEQGELAWYFTGRTAERAAISTWLRERDTGMLVVTGRAGSGKSALLGNILVQSNPKLGDLLARARQLEPAPPHGRPPANCFDAVLHLTGATIGDLVDRIAEAASLTSPQRSPESDGQVRWLLDELARRKRPFTLLVDALDEAQQPRTLAASVLRPLAARANVRVIVGTRSSTREGLTGPSRTTQICSTPRAEPPS